MREVRKLMSDPGFAAQLASMQLADQKIAQLQADLAMFQTARNAYAQALAAELPEVEDE